MSVVVLNELHVYLIKKIICINNNFNLCVNWGFWSTFGDLGAMAACYL